MKPDTRFLRLPKTFWANVRTISQEVGYTVRGRGAIKIPTIDEMLAALDKIGLQQRHIVGATGKPKRLGRNLQDYFAYRAHVLNTYVEPRLMDAKRARKVFRRLKSELRPTCPLPMNKQKGEKRAEAYWHCKHAD